MGIHFSVALSTCFGTPGRQRNTSKDLSASLSLSLRHPSAVPLFEVLEAEIVTVAAGGINEFASPLRHGQDLVAVRIQKNSVVGNGVGSQLLDRDMGILGSVVDGIGASLLGSTIPRKGCDFKHLVPNDTRLAVVDRSDIVEPGKPIWTRSCHSDGRKQWKVGRQRNALERLRGVISVELTVPDDEISCFFFLLGLLDFLFQLGGGTSLGWVFIGVLFHFFAE
ncbi:unnamed protein product [Pseudo-nitzschia multistriata]|uniref:Uncharacterized protein n=1 Tax=Pseudo-nitzschia multistriata TaxID=183589 RepID=A0A448ZC15_9STRA|nr:unnamed protein product [Pseudo-nitzschia multistriata]